MNIPSESEDLFYISTSGSGDFTNNRRTIYRDSNNCYNCNR
ncbi:hypothetical protein LCGC14_0961530 [marine sediment metagenome]|uniref:Uncharacterized protein n=1 Tax=marine sediment metagenome TaxID=412755 RepID=A0A0F9RKW7_9ZZZZ